MEIHFGKNAQAITRGIFANNHLATNSLCKVNVIYTFSKATLMCLFHCTKGNRTGEAGVLGV